LKIIFITGLPASGKTTLAKNIVEYLREKKEPVVHFDADELSEKRLLPDVGDYSLKAREKRAKYLSSLIELINKNKINCIVSITGQPLSIREDWVRLFEKYQEIYLKTSKTTCQARDFKGVYDNKKDVLGVDIAFEEPYCADLIIRTDCLDEAQVFEESLRFLEG
jgi:adenylylsulfate kinase-like enzyme